MTVPELFLYDPAGDSAVTRVLLCVAHPDDIDFGSAGTIAVLRERGVEVTYLIATRGQAGGFDQTPREQMPVIREAEQRAAGAVLGVSDIRFLDYPDGMMTVSIGLRRDLARVIRQVRPHRVIGMSSVRNFELIGVSHPDHLAMGEATLCAVYPDARNEFAFPELLQDEGLEPWKVSEVWCAADPQPNLAVDVTDVIDRKIAALEAHRSQVAHIPDLPAMLRARHARMAPRAGLPEGRLVEAFRRVPTA